MTTTNLQTMVHQLRYEAVGTISVELRPVPPAIAFEQEVEAGAHITLHLAEGLTRSYSLTNPGERHRYVVAVALDKASRGGSRFAHEQLRVGQHIAIGGPRNHFVLDESASHSVLVAGGIGITPIYAMLQRLARLGHTAHLIYCAGSRQDAAFVTDIEALATASAGRLLVDCHFKDERGTRADLPRLLAGHPKGTHFYCCGPQSLIEAYEQVCAQLGLTHMHLERFAAVTLQASQEAGYAVELRKSGRTVQVVRGVSLLDALIDAGMNPDYSCREGVCGACEVRVLSGDVDHRDLILTKQERAANRSMMICVSGCKSESLVLDF